MIWVLLFPYSLGHWPEEEEEGGKEAEWPSPLIPFLI
jgi:hypothetical protein